MTDVRAAAPADWAAVQQIRLTALQDSPDAFFSTYEREAAYGEARWREWTQTARVFLAWDGSEPVGIAAGIVDDEWPDDRHLVSMWVDARARGTRVATDLALAVCDWACGEGAHGTVLWVIDGNDRARAFYERLGFTSTGRRGHLTRDPSMQEECFRRSCPSAAE